MEKEKEKEKKKRGRKPKIKTEDEKPKEPKKRGRKPKPKVENEEPKVPKKRGRKPKERTESEKRQLLKRGRKGKKTIDINVQNYNPFQTKVQSENKNIILNIPLKEDPKENNIDPIPFHPEINGEEYYNQSESILSPKDDPVNQKEIIDYINKREKEEENILEEQEEKEISFEENIVHKKLTENELDIEYNPELNCNQEDQLPILNVTPYNKNWKETVETDQISSFKEKKNEQEFMLDLSDGEKETKLDNLVGTTTKVISSNFITQKTKYLPYHTSNINLTFPKIQVYDSMPQYIDFSNGKEWPHHTNIYCWWDSHPFDGIPIPLPTRYKNNKFHVYGCFCSFSCCVSYALRERNTKSMGLINYLQRRLIGKSEKIVRSPPKESLNIFGGPLTIQEFREASQQLINYKLVKPPLVPIVFQFEKSQLQRIIVEANNSENTSTHDINTEESSLRLKRSKPLPSYNTKINKLMKLK